jgi:hypothetical protein
VKTYKYTDATNTVVYVFDKDGVCRFSMDAAGVPPGATIEPADPPPVPSVVTMRQARLALLAAGLLDDVEAAITTDADRIEWEYATTVMRDSPLVQSLSASLGLTDAQLDALFEQGASL